jgi:hypothetical protein
METFPLGAYIWIRADTSVVSNTVHASTREMSHQRAYCVSPRWSMIIESHSGMLLTWGHGTTLGKTCSSDTLSTINPTCTDPDANRCLRGENLRPGIHLKAARIGKAVVRWVFRQRLEQWASGIQACSPRCSAADGKTVGVTHRHFRLGYTDLFQ